jgi:hypothetical protein
VPRPRLVIRAGTLVLFLFSIGAGSAFAAAPDASCPGTPDGEAGMSADQLRAQTFTALHTGTVTRAEMPIDKLSDGANFQFQVLNTDLAGTPVDQVLGSATIADAAVPNGVSTLAGTFQSPAPVVAGHQYALTIARPGDTNYGVPLILGDPCPGVQFSRTSTIPWTPGPGIELIFALTVEPSNQFSIKGAQGRTLTVNVPNAGALSLAQAPSPPGKGAVKVGLKVLRPSAGSAAAAGDLGIPILLNKSGKHQLRAKGKLKATVAITYAPSGGTPSTQNTVLKLKAKHKKH